MHRVVIKNDALIDVVEKFLHKGSKIYIEGQLETRKFTDRENIERYSTEIVLRPYRGDLKMLDAPKPQPVKPSADKHHSKTEPKPAA
jgi:single-strand DNA-binding protein